MENLQRIHNFRRTIKILIAYIKQQRAREKELLHIITVNNRKIKKLGQQVENYRANKQLKHLKQVVTSQGLRITELNKKINEHEMEKL